MGDCPEIFRPYRLDCQNLFDEDKFLALLRSDAVIGFSEFQQCFVSDVTDTEKTLYDYKGFEELSVGTGSISDLDDDILSWNVNDSMDYHGDNGYLLWLMVGSLALLEPLRDQEFCRHILGGRQTLYLLSGFEEIFFHLATVTPDGLLFEPRPVSTEELPGGYESDEAV